MGLFDSLFGSQKSTVTEVPWNSGSLNHGFLQARALLDQGPLPLYPGATVVGFSPATKTAFEQIEALSKSRVPGLSDAQDLTRDTLLGRFVPSSDRLSAAAAGATAVMSPALLNIMQLARGDHVGHNPASQAITERVARDVSERVNSQFGASGRTGGAYHRQSLARGLGDALADLHAALYARDRTDQLAANSLLQQGFEAERNRQQRAVGDIAGLNALRYAGPEQLRGVGNARDALAQRQRDAAVKRFELQQLAPHDALQRYMAIIGGSIPGSRTQTSPNPLVPDLFRTGLNILTGRF